MTTQTASPNTAAPIDTGRAETRASTRLTVRARSTCAGAHVHVGDLKLSHEEVSDFAARYQARPAISALAKLTSSAVNDIKGTLAPQMGMRVYAVAATALADNEPEHGLSTIDLHLEIESPEDEGAIEQLVDAWQHEFAPAALPEGLGVRVAFRVLNWYGA